jgi:hypothetical protein
MGIGANFFCSFCRPIDGVTQQLGVKWRRQSIHVFFFLQKQANAR